MIFNGQFDVHKINAIDQKVTKICEEHFGCVDCPLKNENMNIDGTEVSCITGRQTAN